MPEPQVPETWQRARLFPTIGIRGAKEQEPRATSALLSVLPAVPSFGKALLKSLGAPSGSISAFTEVRLKDGGGLTHVPDGAIAIEKGDRRWSALVEVKTGRNEVPAEQAIRSLDLARRYGFDAMCTVSNQIADDPEEIPYKLNGKRVGKLIVRLSALVSGTRRTVSLGPDAAVPPRFLVDLPPVESPIQQASRPRALAAKERRPAFPSFRLRAQRSSTDGVTRRRRSLPPLRTPRSARESTES